MSVIHMSHAPFVSFIVREQWALGMCVWHACAAATTSCARGGRGCHFHSVYSSKMMISFEFHLIYFHFLVSFVCDLFRARVRVYPQFRMEKIKPNYYILFACPPRPTSYTQHTSHCLVWIRAVYFISTCYRVSAAWLTAPINLFTSEKNLLAYHSSKC